ncbi:hypothetical protein FRC18_010442 [Serendipita sp. 400]|nr:hypothetical protein FRC18_010442 [Serendipita sp. 400]
MKTVKDAKSCMEDHAQLLFRENIHDKLKKILDSLNDVQSRQKDDDRYTFLQSISGIQCSVHHKKNFTGVLQDTGNWLLEDPDFITWKESNSVLWLHGIPGSGKTKLTAILIDHLIKEDHRVAYFYCIRDTKEQERADPVEILRAILRQLVSLIPDELFDDDSVVKQCVKEREETKKKGEKPSAPDQDQCVKWILQLTTQYSTTIVIDALDECDNHTRHHLFKALTTIVKPQSLVRIFVSSRDDQDIVQHLNGRKNIRIDASKNTEDIRRFVQNEIKVAIDEKRLLRGNVKQELKELIIDKLQNSAQGMFLWVTLQIAALCDQRRINTANAVKQRLDTMPEPLSTLYAEIYEEIMQNFDFPAIKAMLLWLLYSQRQLSSKEVVAITSISTSSEDITPQTILSLCRNLITLDQATNSFTFAHLSVREFLEKREEFNAAVGHATIVMSCFEFFTTPNTSQVQQILHYASLYWPQHYQDYQKVTDNNLQNEEVRKAASILLSNRNPDGGLSTWASVGKKAINSLAWYDGLQEEWKDASFEPFRTTCVFGLPDLVEHCLHSGEQPRDIEYGLYMAVKWNNERVACLVLERLVKLNNVKINLQVLFLAAIQLGMMDAASAMSSREAVLHVGGDAHWTLLHWMVIFRSESGITHLLANRARCNEKDLDGRTPLHFAAMAGYQKGLQLLLEAGARVDMKDDAGWSPWHWAAFMKQNDTIELLNTDQDGNETSSRDHFLSLIMVVVFILKLHEHC